MRKLIDADILAVRIANGRLAKIPLLRPIARSWLARPFPNHRKRILLISVDHELAWQQFHPYFEYRDRFEKMGVSFRVINYDRFKRFGFKGEADAIFIQFPHLHPHPEQGKLLEGLRKAFPEIPIVFFDWFAPTDIRFGAVASPWVTGYVKKAALRDRSLYSKPTRGHTFLEDEVSKRFGLPAVPATWALGDEILDRLQLGASFWASPKQISGFAKSGPHVTADRPIDMHARIAVNGTPWYAAMRQQAKAAVRSSFEDLNIASEGVVDYKSYMAELGQSRLCFSPFGYGEICWRDYEAILMGAVLIKPDMSHIESEPDIYIADETYVPVRWDLADLEDRVRALLADPSRRKKIATAAFEQVHNHLLSSKLEDGLKRLLKPL